MKFDTGILTNEERVILALRTLFHRYGYTRYKMSKFEEYDLYACNKDYLVTDNIITFNDINGKLMALKPDVTLSIARNSRDCAGGVQKVYYNESVYRVARGGRNFKEITQIGLECIGDIDEYQLSEVVLLALKSLECASDEFRLTISQTDLPARVINELGLDYEKTKEVYRCVGQKNLHELEKVCAQADEGAFNRLMGLLNMSEDPGKALAELRELGFESEAVGGLARLVETINECGYGGRLSIDFSIVGDTSYYNGVAFKGYISGIPEAVVSGGQYDGLMRRLGKRGSAIGFAVYMDLLERLGSEKNEFDADMVLMYDEGTDIGVLARRLAQLTGQGLRVVAASAVPEKLKYRTLARLNGGEVKILEEYA